MGEDVRAGTHSTLKIKTHWSQFTMICPNDGKQTGHTSHKIKQQLDRSAKVHMNDVTYIQSLIYELQLYCSAIKSIFYDVYNVFILHFQGGVKMCVCALRSQYGGVFSEGKKMISV